MKSPHALRRGIATITIALALTGCYTQRPLTLSVPAPATRIVAEVTDTGTVAMGSSIGVGAVQIEGVVSRADASVWTLNLIRVDHRGGLSTLWNREEVSFPRLALTNVRERKVDRKRSWIAAGVVTIGVVIATRLFGSVLGGENDGREPPPPF